MKTMPNFIIIGAAKSGTTALYQYLQQHPQIYMSPVKEPQFFAFEGEQLNYQGVGVAINQSITTLEDYQTLFQDAANEIAIGEASALYLYVPKAPERIKYYLPDVKLIAILRNPIERAHAAFLHLIRDGREPFNDFKQALEAEPIRIENHWGFLWRYRDMGFYALQLKRYLKNFDRSQLKIYLYDDFLASPLPLLQDLFDFLGVERGFIPDMSFRPNRSGIPQNKRLHQFLKQKHWLKEMVKPLLPQKTRNRMADKLVQSNLTKVPIPAESKTQLIGTFREDILELQQILDRDLSHWLI
ncbi:MAG: sulfotransferase [Cyanobacteriota bacterium]|nr:sulfotransferase [Cyanobacteriota bacterium]